MAGRARTNSLTKWYQRHVVAIDVTVYVALWVCGLTLAMWHP